MTERITSLQNPKIKNIIRLEKAKEREEQNLFLIEGLHEGIMAVRAGYQIHSIFYCPDIIAARDIEKLVSKAGLSEGIFEITKEVYQKIAYRTGTEGLCILARPVKQKLNELRLSQVPLILVLEAVEKPGNLGAILRTADAAGLDAVIICDPKTDFYNPNVVRSSIGCLFTVQTASCTNEEALDFLNTHGIKAYAAALTAEHFYQETDFDKPSAIIMGTESTGLSDFWLYKSEKQIKIPMLGKIDSLNVSTSAAILVFEAMRQRGFRRRY